MKNSFLVLVSILTVSCIHKVESTPIINADLEAKSQSEIVENLDWITGNWKRLNEQEGKETFENWQKISSTEYSGIGFTMKNGDTINQEKMELNKVNDKWTLAVKMPNEKIATHFELIELSDTKFVCSNDSIDFPNKIEYWLENNRMKAKISNSEMEIPFEFEKLN